MTPRSDPARSREHSDDGAVTDLVCCVDFGSTFTKAALVDAGSAALIATATNPTTLDSDVLDGWDQCRARLGEVHAGALTAPVLACSSAGGGLRIAVVGNEQLVTAEAGWRVALSSGGRVVHVAYGTLDDAGVERLRDACPDVVLLVGGTDGGNAEVLLGCANSLAGAGWAGPVVLAGNVDAQADVSALFDASGTPHVVTDNVVPRIGVLRPEPARAAIREMFLRHVIGGKHLSKRSDFVEMVRGATPDVVLTAVELLARGPADGHPGAGDLVVVDVGGATTDVHSVVEVDADEADGTEPGGRGGEREGGLDRQVVATVPVSRTVEGDLGMRWSAVATVEAGVATGMVDGTEGDALLGAARRLRLRPSDVPGTDEDRAVDARIATIAVATALRRHAGRQQVTFGPDGRLVERSGKDLRGVGLLVGSGGVLRHNGPGFGPDLLRRACRSDRAAGWMLPVDPRVAVDADYVMAAAGLLADDDPMVAYALLCTVLR